MDEFKFSFGAMPSTYDARDYKIDKLISASVQLPKTYQNPIKGPVFNQQTSSQCVACSLSLTRYLQEYNQSNNREKFSPSYIYGNRTATMYQGEGMYPREALKMLQKSGVVHWDSLPNFTDYPTAHNKYLANKDALDKEAYPFRISSYYKLNTINEIKTAIYTLGAVSAMFPVYEELYHPNKGKVSYIAHPENEGYHQMTIIGWNEEGWIVQNSWGNLWGINGICYIDYNYPIMEAWAITDSIIEEKFQSQTKSQSLIKNTISNILKKIKNWQV